MACSAKPCSLILQNAFTVNTILTILKKKKENHLMESRSFKQLGGEAPQ